MPIYDILEHVGRQEKDGQPAAGGETHISGMTLARGESSLEDKGHLFTTIAARLFFFMLLLADLAWFVYTALLFISSLFCLAVTGGKITLIKKFFRRRYLNMKRGSISAVALIVSLFSPALGTMIACSYFLMYDKKGVEEIVPSVLQDQFQEFFQPLKP